MRASDVYEGERMGEKGEKGGREQKKRGKERKKRGGKRERKESVPMEEKKNEK